MRLIACQVYWRVGVSAKSPRIRINSHHKKMSERLKIPAKSYFATKRARLVVTNAYSYLQATNLILAESMVNLHYKRKNSTCYWPAPRFFACQSGQANPLGGLIRINSLTYKTEVRI